MKTPLLAAFLLVAACGPRDLTETVIVLRAAPAVRAETTSVRVVVSARAPSANAFVERERRTIVLDASGPRFPLFLPVRPREGDDLRTFRVEATALAGSSERVVSRGRVEAGFMAGETRVAELFLDEECATVVCGESETCLDAACVPSAVPLESLVDPGAFVDRCEYDHGGCDPVVTCEHAPARAVCGACPAGYVGEGDTDCRLDDPALVSLVPSVGRAEPFGEDATEITVRLLVDSANVTLRAETREAGAGSIMLGTDVFPAGASSPSIAVPLGKTSLTLTVVSETGRTRAYVVHLVRAIEAGAYVKAPTPAPGALFASTALSGDTLVVGAPREDVRLPSGALVTRAGAVHVYRQGRDGTVTFEQTLLASNAGNGDEFGYDVQVDGDRMIVSAPFEDSAATTVNGARDDEGRTDSGAVYVFERTGRIWREVAYLKVPAEEPGRTVGMVIALDGNIVVAGTGLDDGPAGATPNSGAAYVFERTDAGYVHRTTLRAPVPRTEDRFGTGLDVDGTTIVVGAFLEDTTAAGMDGGTGYDAGAAYVFTRATSGTYVFSAQLKASHTTALDQFGLSVAISGEVIAVGARGEDSSSTASNPDPSVEGLTDSGAVFVFTRVGSAWTQTAYLKAHATSTGDRFGNGVALDGNVLVVSAPSEDGSLAGVNPAVDENALESGAAYVYLRQGAGFVFHAYLKPEAIDAGDLFAALSVDAGRIFIGSRLEDGGNQDPGDDSMLDAGAAFLFE